MIAKNVDVQSRVEGAAQSPEKLCWDGKKTPSAWRVLFLFCFSEAFHDHQTCKRSDHQLAKVTAIIPAIGTNWTSLLILLLWNRVCLLVWDTCFELGYGQETIGEKLAYYEVFEYRPALESCLADQHCRGWVRE